MPPHESCEGGIVALRDETPQKLPIGQPRSVLQQNGSAEVLDDLAHLALRHQVPSFLRWPRALYLLITRSGLDSCAIFLSVRQTA
jgi:hypothetical protein